MWVVKGFQTDQPETGTLRRYGSLRPCEFEMVLVNAFFFGGCGWNLWYPPPPRFAFNCNVPYESEFEV